jgi:hypothetical protein
MDGALSGDQEDAVCRAVLGQRGLHAQPMTGWLLSSLTLWGHSRDFSKKLATILGVTHKTWEAGPPKSSRKWKRAVQGLNRHIAAALAESDPATASRRKRAIFRTNEALSLDQTIVPCTFFHQTIGIAGSDALEMLAVGVDEISAAILKGEAAPEAAASLVVGLAVRLEVVGPSCVTPRPDLDPGLDAVLMLYARLDRDLFQLNHPDGTHITSIFALLVDAPGAGPRKRARQRLLDLYYAISLTARGLELPVKAPSVNQLEDVLIGGPPASGGQSWITRWRNGRKHLHLKDVSAMVTRIRMDTQFDLDASFRVFWLVAQLWELIEIGGADAVAVAGARYRLWWEAMEDSGRSAVQPTHPYWRIFQPHA